MRLYGNITANGAPRNETKTGRYKTHGGSGGFIYLKFLGTSPKVFFGKDSWVNAKGGHGVNGGFSGAGGRVIM